MFIISASDLKPKGVKAFKETLAGEAQAALLEASAKKYVVIQRERYAYLRECELADVLSQSKVDIAGGRFVSEMVEDHLKRLKRLDKRVPKIDSA